MSIDGNKEFVQRYLNLVEARDVDAAAAMIADSARWWVVGLGEVGKADILQAYRGVFERTTHISLNIVNQVSEGDQIVTEINVSYAMKDGRSETNSILLIATVANGQIVSAREYMDISSIQEFAING